MSALVMGATGLVGSHVLDALVARGEAVRALVRTPGKAEELRARGLDVAVADIRDLDALRDALRGVDVVYHCTSPDLAGTRNLLEIVRQAGHGRVVMITGLSVLGDYGPGAGTEDLPYQHSRNPEFNEKIAIERVALEYAAKHGLQVTILRPGFIYGPRDTRNLPQIADAVRQGKLVYIGSRDNVMPLVHVSDMVQAMLRAAVTPAAAGRVYNVGDGSRTTIGEFVNCLAELLGCPPPRRVLPYFLPHLAVVVVEWLSWLSRINWPAPITRDGLFFLGTSRPVDIRRAVKELGYAPQVTYREGLRTTLQWMERENQTV